MPRTISILTPTRRFSPLTVIMAFVASAALAGLTIPPSHSSPESTLLANSDGAAANAQRSDLRRAAIPPPAVKESSVTAAESTSAGMKEAYGVLPLSFEANGGQTDRKVMFLARGQGYGLFLTSTGAVISLNKASDRQDAGGPGHVDEVSKTLPTDKSAVLSMQLVGARRSPRISGIDALPGKTNYFVGNDPGKWRKGIPTYSKVRYRGVYPGIDVVYYGNQRQLEYDFVVAPGKDPRRIRLAFKGTSGMSLDPSGNLVLSTPVGEIRQAKPFAYQEVDGDHREIAARYRVDQDSVTFEVGDYDKSQPLIIDPVLVYSSFLGGANGDQGFAIAVDSQGSAHLTGRTTSTDFSPS
ncbi:MAG: hypothetical protein H0U18_09095 [Pyrinomonadaceae bacterium]|nr:hypothetical protein [Pyrinomonadaceae bacterium]